MQIRKKYDALGQRETKENDHCYSHKVRLPIPEKWASEVRGWETVWGTAAGGMAAAAVAGHRY